MTQNTPKLNRVSRSYPGSKGRPSHCITWEVIGYDGVSTGDSIEKKRAADKILAHLIKNPGMGTWEAYEEVRNEAYDSNCPHADDF